MHRLWEILLGLDKGFLGRDGELHWHFNPHWPFQQTIGAVSWNLLLGVASAFLIWRVYSREGRSNRARILLAIMRAALLALIIALLNKPGVTLEESVNEPSVLAIVVDDTISMQVRDAADAASPPTSRLEAVTSLLTADNASLLRDLAKTHVIKFYSFSTTASATAADTIATATQWKDDAKKSRTERDAAATVAVAPAVGALDKLQPVGNSTQVVATVRSILQGLQGQHVAGVVILTDGRDTPAENLNDAMAAVKNFGVKVYPIPVGSEDAPRNIDVRSISVQDSAFKDDVVNVKAVVHGSGYEAGHPVHLVLYDGKTKLPLRGPDNLPVEQTIQLYGDKPQNVELQFKARQTGIIDVTVEAKPEFGEINDTDNRRHAALEVLDTRINVFYVEGYPRWEYRNIKNEMLREPTINLSCVLLSSDSGFTQEHSKVDGELGLKYFPYSKFPETLEQLQEADVVLFGDVDPERISNSQMQLVRTFVEEYSGGFGMIAGTRWSPVAFRNTPIQDLLPVTITALQPDRGGPIAAGFRAIITKDGQDSSIFRFFTDHKRNDLYLKEQIPPIFWYFHSVPDPVNQPHVVIAASPKAGVGEVLSEHPTDTLAGDGHPAPILVAGHFGAGRTLYAATDDSWRWRFYTGESVYDTYWIQQLRYLARGKKLGSRGMTFTALRDSYELGDQIRLSLHILNRKLLPQLAAQLGVQVIDAAGQVVRRENLIRQEGQSDSYIVQFPADRIGAFTVKLPPPVPGARELNVRLDVNLPAKELEQPQVDRSLLNRLALETNASLPGQAEPKLIELTTARADLLRIPTAARSVPRFSDMPLWDAPLALVIFVLLITAEWVLRKVFGML